MVSEDISSMHHREHPRSRRLRRERTATLRSSIFSRRGARSRRRRCCSSARDHHPSVAASILLRLPPLRHRRLAEDARMRRSGLLISISTQSVHGESGAFFLLFCSSRRRRRRSLDRRFLRFPSLLSSPPFSPPPLTLLFLSYSLSTSRSFTLTLQAPFGKENSKQRQ